MKNIITESAAVICAVRYAALEACAPRCLEISHCGGLYNLILRTDYQCYEFYVDDCTGEVLGLSAVPGLDLDSYPSNNDDCCIALPGTELCA